MILNAIILAVTSAVFSAAGVEIVRRWAVRRSILDVPNERSSHSAPTPHTGGVAIDGVILVGVAGLRLLGSVGSVRAVAGYAIATIMLAAVSLLDDLRPLSARIRLMVQIAVSAGFLFCVGPVTTIGPFIAPAAVGAALAMLWLIGVTNIYNFMDGIDGIAGLQGVIAGCAWTIVGLITGDPLLTLLAALVGGSVLGFLFHNWAPARIFMGDVASAVLGFTYAAMPLLAHDSQPAIHLCALLFLWPFLFDASFTLLRRLRKGENIFAAHRSHLYQRLVLAGRSHGHVTSLYGSFAILGAVCGIFTLQKWIAAPAAIAIMSLTGFVLWLDVVLTERRALRGRAAIPSRSVDA